jgi:hypothetical protein
MTEEKHLELWNSVQKTNPKHTKQANVGGNRITAISPQYQRMSATAKFGPFGEGWGIKEDTYDTMNFPDSTVLGSYRAKLWYKMEGEIYEFPIYSNIKVAFTTNAGKYKVDDEWLKKASTDALTKGLSMLGFNADIFLGLYDDSKYVEMVTNEFEEKISPEQVKRLYSLGATQDRVKDVYVSWVYGSASDIPTKHYEAICCAITGQPQPIQQQPQQQQQATSGFVI